VASGHLSLCPSSHRLTQSPSHHISSCLKYLLTGRKMTFQRQLISREYTSLLLCLCICNPSLPPASPLPATVSSGDSRAAGGCEGCRSLPSTTARTPWALPGPSLLGKGRPQDLPKAAGSIPGRAASLLPVSRFFLGEPCPCLKSERHYEG